MYANAPHIADAATLAPAPLFLIPKSSNICHFPIRSPLLIYTPARHHTLLHSYTHSAAPHMAAHSHDSTAATPAEQHYESAAVLQAVHNTASRRRGQRALGTWAAARSSFERIQRDRVDSSCAGVAGVAGVAVAAVGVVVDIELEAAPETLLAEAALAAADH